MNTRTRIHSVCVFIYIIYIYSVTVKGLDPLSIELNDVTKRLIGSVYRHIYLEPYVTMAGYGTN